MIPIFEGTDHERGRADEGQPHQCQPSGNLKRGGVATVAERDLEGPLDFPGCHPQEQSNEDHHGQGDEERQWQSKKATLTQGAIIQEGRP